MLIVRRLFVTGTYWDFTNSMSGTIATRVIRVKGVATERTMIDPVRERSP